MTHRMSRFATLMRIGVLSFMLFSLGSRVLLTHAPSTIDPTPDNDPHCLRDLQVNTFTATPSTINFRGSTTLTWKVIVPSGYSTLYRSGTRKNLGNAFLSGNLGTTSSAGQ